MFNKKIPTMKIKTRRPQVHIILLFAMLFYIISCAEDTDVLEILEESNEEEMVDEPVDEESEDTPEDDDEENMDDPPIDDTPDEGVFDDPNNPDDDFDGLPDSVETGTGIFVDANDTGTNPLKNDSDNDGAGDWYEVTASFTNPLDASSTPNLPYPIPASDNSAGDSSKPVKVYILSGQSNMVGFGRVAGTEAGTLETMTGTENKFPHLVNADGTWVEYEDVYYRGVITDIGNSKLRPFMAGDKFGPELGFGMAMGYHHDEPVLVIKTSQGNRSLSWDCLPPGSQQYTYNNDGNTYAGYGDPRDKWATNTEPEPFVWYAGKQYDDYFLDESDFGCNTVWASGASYDNGVYVRNGTTTYTSKGLHTAALDTKPGEGANWQNQWNIHSVFNVTDILDNFASEYPQWAGQGFEIAGFVWWQGHKDQNNVAASRYEQNLVQFINSLRAYYGNRYPGKIAEDAPFVLATIAFDGWNLNGAGLEVANAQLAVSGETGNYPDFQNNVKTVEARGYWRDFGPNTNQGFHYNHNAETYLLVGDALGRAMIDLNNK